MSLAWTTALIIALILPGVAFFLGLSWEERHSREIIRSAAVGDIAMAFFVAALIHFLFVGLPFQLDWYDAADYMGPLTDYDHTPHAVFLEQAFSKFIVLVEYIVVTTIVGYGVGFGFAHLMMRGPLRTFAIHEWYYDLVKGRKDGFVTTFVMTKTSDGSSTLIYSGHLTNFYLNADGNFSYIVLKDYSRHFLDLAKNQVMTPGTRLVPTEQKRLWNHLVISGDNISNVTFDPVRNVAFAEVDEGAQLLDARLSEDRSAIQAAAEPPDLQGG
jgi:hypothetical protein